MQYKKTSIKRKDKDKYKKLYSSAKRRRLADINRIDQALSDFERFMTLEEELRRELAKEQEID